MCVGKYVTTASSAQDKYANSLWNLNKLAKFPGSLLNALGQDIAGITVPWLYIGMMFSTFCWHNEGFYFFLLFNKPIQQILFVRECCDIN
jgi:hypothetical protein